MNKPVDFARQIKDLEEERVRCKQSLLYEKQMHKKAEEQCFAAQNELSTLQAIVKSLEEEVTKKTVEKENFEKEQKNYKNQINLMKKEIEEMGKLFKEELEEFDKFRDLFIYEADIINKNWTSSISNYDRSSCEKRIKELNELLAKKKKEPLMLVDARNNTDSKIEEELNEKINKLTEEFKDIRKEVEDMEEVLMRNTERSNNERFVFESSVSEKLISEFIKYSEAVGKVFTLEEETMNIRSELDSILDKAKKLNSELKMMKCKACGKYIESKNELLLD